VLTVALRLYSMLVHMDDEKESTTCSSDSMKRDVECAAARLRYQKQQRPAASAPRMKE
jgi:hypothetical protein